MLSFELMFLSVSAKLTKDKDYEPHHPVMQTSIKKFHLLNCSLYMRAH